jgi:predicted Zn-dependent protease
MRWRCLACASVLSLWVSALSIFAPRAFAQDQQSDWRVQVRKYCDANDWPAALRVVDQRLAQAPNDLDLKAWHARVLGWSGNLAEAQQEYLAILSVSPNDPDVWAGLGSVYAREGKDYDALLALGRAVQLDPKRADLRIAYARALREAEMRNTAAAELKNAASPDLSGTKAPYAVKAGRPCSDWRTARWQRNRLSQLLFGQSG